MALTISKSQDIIAVNENSSSLIITEAKKILEPNIVFCIKSIIYNYFECKLNHLKDYWVQKTEKGCRVSIKSTLILVNNSDSKMDLNEGDSFSKILELLNPSKFWT